MGEEHDDDGDKIHECSVNGEIHNTCRIRPIISPAFRTCITTSKGSVVNGNHSNNNIGNVSNSGGTGNCGVCVEQG